MSGTPYPKTCEFLKRNRIDPEKVAVDGFSVSGYNEIVIDPKTKKRVLGPNGPQMIRREWPSFEIGKKAWDIFAQEAGMMKVTK